MPEKPAKVASITSEIRRRLKDADFLLILAAIPVFLLLALAPGSFELSWAGFGKLGRGGLFIVLFFLGFELYLYDFRKHARLKLTFARKMVLSAIVMATLVYFIGVGVDASFVNLLYSLGPPGGAGGGSNSWLMSVDYLTFAIYILALAVVLFGFGLTVIKGVITPILLSGAMVIFYLLDAFFPYGEIGSLQFWANFIVAAVGLLAKLFGLPIYGFSNYLTIEGTKGFFRLAVFWPSVGVQSIIIYSVVMLVIAAKLDIPKVRKVIYAAVGVAGTVFLNILRIFTIAYYGYAFATSGQQLDAFHNSLGEVIFPFWILLFLGIVLHIESRITPKTTIHARMPSRPTGKSRKLGAR